MALNPGPSCSFSVSCWIWSARVNLPPQLLAGGNTWQVKSAATRKLIKHTTSSCLNAMMKPIRPIFRLPTITSCVFPALRMKLYKLRMWNQIVSDRILSCWVALNVPEELHRQSARRDVSTESWLELRTVRLQGLELGITCWVSHACSACW